MNAALENPKVDIIVFGNDITLDSTLIINKAVTIDGNGYSVNQAIYITEDEVTIKNLTGKVVPREEHKISGIGGQSAFVVSADNVVLDNITVDGKSEANSAAVRGLWDAQFEVINSNISNVQTGIFAHHGNTKPEAGQNVLIATGNTFTNVWAGIGGTEKTDLTATGNTFVSIQDNGEGIGLGDGVVVIGADTEDDVNYLETNNTFNYSEGNKVVDYRSVVANTTQKEYFDSILEAYNAAVTGDTILLVKDIEVEGQLFIRKNITIDGNSKTITSTASEASKHSAIKIDSLGSGTTIKNLTVNASGYTGDVLYVSTATDVVITGNTFKSTDNNAMGVYFDKTSSGGLEGNTIVGRKGVGADTVEEVSIKNNNITFTDKGIELHDGTAERNTKVIDNSSAEGNAHEQYTVSGNTFNNVAK